MNHESWRPETPVFYLPSRIFGRHFSRTCRHAAACHSISAMNEPIAPAVLGLDIGGANLKSATCSGVIHTRPFPLWKHPERLATQIREIRAEMPSHDLLAMTM